MRTIVRIHLLILFFFSLAFGQSFPTSTSLTVSPVSQATFGQAFTLTATVLSTSNGAPVTTGGVTFYDAGVPIGVSGPLNSSGVGTFKTSLLSSGNHALSAIYQGTGSFAKSSSTVVSRQVGNTASGGFGPQRGYGTGSSPEEVVQDDFNGDGVTDLALVNLLGTGSGPGTVTVFLGNGDGTFATPLSPAPIAGNLPGGIATGDFNEDGKTDLVVANFQDGTVTVFLWNPVTGNFTAQTPISVGGGPQKVVVGDLNGDGHMDIITSNGLDNKIGVLLGNGNGTFGSVTAYGGTNGLNNPYGMVLGDFNNDGITDVAIASRNNGIVVVLAGNGTGGFLATPIATITLPANATPQKILSAALNSSDTTDLVVGDVSSARVFIIPYSTSGGFGTVVSQATTTANVYGLGVTDVDGDGNLDIVVAGSITSSPNYLEVLRGNGAGSYSNFQTTSLSLNPSADPVALVVGDFNGDGRADVAIADVNLNGLEVSLGQVPTTLTLSAPSPNPSTYGQSLTLTANVSPSTGPTGSVTFYVDGTQIGSAVSIVSGQAQISIAGPTVGTYSITAIYSGDSVYGGSTATAVTATVNPASTTTALTSSRNPATSGQSVTFTATLSASGATGTVTFNDGSTPIGTGTVSGGVATYTTSTLSVTTHSITAVYSGDTNYAASTSSTLTQVVNSASQTITFNTLLPNVILGSAPFTAVATATSGLTVTFISTTTGVCTVSVATVTLVSAGICSLTAAQSGNGSYAAAAAITQNFTVDPASAAITVSSAAGSSSWLLPWNGAWTANSNSSFLHISTGSASGTGSAVVAFTYDGFPGTGTRSGTVTIAGLTLTVTQVGTNYSPATGLTTLVPSGLNYPTGVAVDSFGNVYIADSLHNAIKKWTASTQTVTTLVSSGLSGPWGVAVDGSGNVYFSDAGNEAIKEWNASTQAVTTLVSSGLSSPAGVAVDGSGNVYIVDYGNEAIKEWNASTRQVTALVSSGLNLPGGVAVDAAGNVYIADTHNNAIKEWNASTQQVTALVSSGLDLPKEVAVDGSGNVYIADSSNNAIKEWSASTQAVTTLVSSGVGYPYGLAADGSGNVYIADTGNNAIEEVLLAFVGPASLTETSAAGSDSLLQAIPSTQSLTGINAPTSNQSWLTLGTPANGVVPFTFTANAGSTPRTANITIFGLTIPVTQAATPAPAFTCTNNNVPLEIGGAYATTCTVTGGSGTSPFTWTISAGALPAGVTFNLTPTSITLTGPATVSGAANYTVQVSDATSRSATQAFSGTIATAVAFTCTNNNVPTTAGAAYTTTCTVTSGTGVSPFTWSIGAGALPAGVTSSTTATSITLTGPATVSGAANYTIQVSDAAGGNATQAFSGTIPGTSVAYWTFSNSGNLGADSSGNGYNLTQLGDGAIGFDPAGLGGQGAAVFNGSNYFNLGGASPAFPALLPIGNASYTITAWINPGTIGAGAYGIVGWGNYGSNDQTNAFRTDTGGGLDNYSWGDDAVDDPPGFTVYDGNWHFVAVTYDGTSGNRYVYIDPATSSISPFQSNPANTLNVQPTNFNVGVTCPGPCGGEYFQGEMSQLQVFNYALTTAQVDALDIPPAIPTLGTGAILVSSAAGSSSVVLSNGGVWTATSNSSFLHISSGSASGTGSAVVAFTYDAFSGTGTRSGTLTVDGLTVTVTQVGTNYIGPGALTTLVSGLYHPWGVAVDKSGNVYIADTTDDSNDAIKEWNASTGQVTTLVSSGLHFSEGVAVDGSGNVYIADSSNQAIKEWNASTGQVTTLVSAGLSYPYGVAVDGSGNVYIGDQSNNAVKEWNASTGQVTTLVSAGLSFPEGVAVDGSGNVYIADSNNNAIKEWNASTGQVTTLVSAGLNGPWGVAVDGSGNVYIADRNDNAIKEWSASTGQLTTLASAGLSSPTGVAVDSAGNVYIADTSNDVIEEVPFAFVGPASLIETPAAGSDSLLQVIPSTQSLTGVYAPTSDQSWLTLGTPANGVVPFTFTANAGSTPRTANITILGQTIPLAQQTGQTTTTLTSSQNPATSGQSVTFTATISATGATGTVTFNDGSTAIGTGTVSGGVATYTTSTLSITTHSIAAVYSGDSNYLGSTSSALSQVVNKGSTTTSLTSSNNPSGFGGSVTVTATVSSPLATGTVTFTDANGSFTLGTGTLSGGTATFTTSALAIGQHPITAAYGGDTNFTGSTSSALTQSVTGAVNIFSDNFESGALVSQNTNWRSNQTGLVVPDPLNPSNHALEFTGDGSGGDLFSIPLPNNSANYYLSFDYLYVNPPYGGGFIGVDFPGETWLSGDCVGCFNGAYSQALNTTANNLAANQWHHIQIQFPNFNTGSSTFDLKLEQFVEAAPNAFFDNIAISTSGFGLQQLTIAAPPLAAAILGSPYSATLLTGGITPYTCSVSTGTLPAGLALNPTTCVLSGTPTAVAVSTFTIGVLDSELPAQTATQAYTLAVLQPTVTSLTSSRNPSPVGQPVTFTSAVSPSTATGTVTLYDGPTVVGGPTALSNGSATIAVPSLAQGAHPITASYSGDASDTPSASSLIGSPLNFSTPAAGTLVDSAGNGTGFTSRLSGTGASISGNDPNLTLNTDSRTLTLQSTESDLNGQVNLGPAEFIGIPLSTLGIGTGQDFSVTATFRNVQYSQQTDQFGLFAGTASNSAFRSGAIAYPTLNAFSVETQSGQDTQSQASTSLAPSVGDTVTFTLGSTGGNWTFSVNNLTNPSKSGPIALIQPTFLNGQPLTVGVFAANSGNTSGKTETIGSFAIGTPYQLVILPTQVSSTTTLSSSPNPADPGQATTLTATVTPTVATGSVRFFDGTTNVGQATLVNGVASLSVTLTSGSHSLTAVYSGDDSYFSSTSAATGETVNQPLTITGSLPPGTVGQSYSASLSASGGSGGYVFRGTLPAGLTLSSTGSIGGTPTVPSSGSVLVTLSDSAGQSTTTGLPLTITALPVSISGNSSLGDVPTGSSVAGSFTATGGVPPYKWSLSGGGGLGVDSNGNVRGTASSAGTFSPTLTLTDSVGTTSTLTLSLAVLGLTGNFPAGTTTSSYSGSASGVGGSGSYTYTGSGIPAGLSFSAGALTGTALNAGTYTIGVTVTDSGGASVSGSFTFKITGPAPSTLTVTSSSLPDGFATQPYSQTFSAGGGAPGYTWSQTGGQLPAGLSLNGGTVFGTPTTPGSYSFGVQVTDTSGGQALGTISINVQPAPLVFTSGGSLPTGQVSVDYPNQILTASGGTPPYSFSIKSGSLPGGLTFSNGQIGGTPTATGAFGVTVLATDSAATPATATLAVSGAIKPLSPDLVLSAASASFAITSGTSAAPAPTTVAVSSTVVSQALGFSASSSVPWISVGGSTSTPGSISLSLNNSGLALSAAGSPYAGTVTVTCGTAPCTGNSQAISVSLTVTNSPPQLTLGSPLLSFTASATSPQASSLALGIVNSGGGSLAITSVTAADTWISVDAVPATVAPGPGGAATITVNPGSLAPGYYLSSVTVNSNAGNSTVPVTLLISASSVMTLGPAGTQFSMQQGGAVGNPNGSFLVSVATGSIGYTAAVLPGATWLSGGGSGTATPSSPGTVTFSISQSAASALPAGAYYGTIEVAGTGIFNSPQEFQVILNISKPGTRAIPDPEPAGLIFITSAAKAAPPQKLQLFASSVTPIPFQASASPIDGTGWLLVTPTAGSTSASAPAPITVNVNASALAAGVYRGTVSFAFATAVRSTNITLIVQSALAGGSATSALAPKDNPVCASGQLVATQTGLVTNFSAPASWPTPMIIQLVDSCGNNVNGGQVVTTFSNGDPPLVLSPLDSTSGTYAGTWTPRKTSAQLAIVARASVPGYSSATVQIAGQVTPNTVPVLAPNGTYDVFHPQTGASLGPGNIVQIYGTGLANLAVSPAALPLPTTVNGTTVLIGGVQAPLYYVSPGQINAQVPFELAAGNQYQVIVSANGALTTPQPIQLSAAVPSVLQFTSGATVAQHLDGTLVLDSSPAQPGENVVIYLTGLGATDVAVPSGAPSPSNPLANVLDVPVLTWNGNAVPIEFAGLTPTLVGLYQINFQVPANATTGEYQLAISQDGNVSNTTVLSVHQ